MTDAQVGRLRLRGAALDGDASRGRHLAHFVADGAKVRAGVPRRGVGHRQRHGAVRVQAHVVFARRPQTDPIAVPCFVNKKKSNDSLPVSFLGQPRIFNPVETNRSATYVVKHA